jgi:DNA-binding transcriptional ArsR family regulator
VALAAGASVRDIAERFDLTKSAVSRHAKSHLPVGVIEAARAVELVRAEDILAQLAELQASALAVLKKAESVGDLRAATGAITSARGNLELIARLVGELREGPVVNLVVSPEWTATRSVILAALVPFPEARAAVVEALMRHEARPEGGEALPGMAAYRALGAGAEARTRPGADKPVVRLEQPPPGVVASSAEEASALEVEVLAKAAGEGEP